MQLGSAPSVCGTNKTNETLPFRSRYPTEQQQQHLKHNIRHSWAQLCNPRPFAPASNGRPGTLFALLLVQSVVEAPSRRGPSAARASIPLLLRLLPTQRCAIFITCSLARCVSRQLTPRHADFSVSSGGRASTFNSPCYLQPEPLPSAITPGVDVIFQHISVLVSLSCPVFCLGRDAFWPDTLATLFSMPPTTSHTAYARRPL
ncbi:hypothetical protein LZ32DRAFT_112658 [Colletotrichum eremochloae]|nr:hypothetical protein LZ32DRAFT_112658 [Colletotrichum eremochloae]